MVTACWSPLLRWLLKLHHCHWRQHCRSGLVLLVPEGAPCGLSQSLPAQRQTAQLDPLTTQAREVQQLVHTAQVMSCLQVKDAVLL